MIRTAAMAALALFALAPIAEARQHPHLHPDCNVTMPCAVPPMGRTPGIGRSYQRHRFMSGDRISGIVAPLAAKVASIQSACPGTHVISGVRHTRIKGSRKMSLHAEGKAVDVVGPYACIYAELRDWPGGYSTDAGRVRHVHISYDVQNGREMGIRFVHGRKKVRRYASR